MQERAVRRRGWLDDEEFVSAVAVTNLVPGPNSTEMAIHLGYTQGGRPGGIISGMAFILPAFLLMLALSWAYFEWRDVGWVGDFFYGVKPVVPAIVALAVYRLGRSAVVDVPLAVIAALAFAATLLLPLAEPLYLVAAGLAGLGLYGSLSRRAFALLPLGSLPVVVLASASTYLELAWVSSRPAPSSSVAATS